MGEIEGDVDGLIVGVEGTAEGLTVGASDGVMEGLTLGAMEGMTLGAALGFKKVYNSDISVTVSVRP